MALFPISGDAVQFDSGSPSSTDPFRNGIRLVTDNSAAYAATADGAKTQNGFLLTNSGAVVCVDATGGLPVGAVWINGLPFDEDGALCVSSNQVAYFSNGIPFEINGAVASNGIVSQGSLMVDGYQLLVDSYPIIFS